MISHKVSLLSKAPRIFDNHCMESLGTRMRARAEELGLSGTLAAARIGISQQRYAAYVADKHEPNLATLVKICRVLQISPTALLGYEAAENSNMEERLHGRLLSAVGQLEAEDFQVMVELAEAFARITAKRRKG